jgi:hypothetical protein
VILDSGQRTWAVATLGALVASTALYLVYAGAAPVGPRGGSAPGLAFGILAFAFMLFAGLIGARRALRTWRLGRASTWLKGHIWLSLLVLPLVLFHGGFRLGGSMTTVLMALLAAVTLSGIVGLVLQNLLPRVMTERVPLETVYEQIPEVVDQLRQEADAKVVAVCGPLEPAENPETKAAPEGSAPLKETYLEEIRPFLLRKGGRPGRLARPASANLVFSHLRTLLPPALHETVNDLASICEERRQLLVQQRIHLWLHLWILAHAPLSYALLILTTAHAVIALRY